MKTINDKTITAKHKLNSKFFINYMLFLPFFLMISVLPGVFSSSELSMMISSQEPDPVRPANYADISVMLTNAGDEAVQEASIEIEENKYLSLAANENRVDTIGAVPAFSTTQEGFVILKKRVYIDEDTPIGELEFDVKVETQSSEFTKTLTLVVRDSKPSLEIKPVPNRDKLTYTPGELKPFSLSLENNQDITLKNIKVSLLFDSNEQDSNQEQASQFSQTQSTNPFFITPGVNSKRINQISSNQNTNISFNLGVSPGAQIQPYQLPVLVEYEDVLGNTYKEEFQLYIIVNAPVELLVNLDRVENNQATFSIANPGPGIVKGAYINFKNENEEIFSTQYLGNLNADDFQTLQSEIKSSNTSQDITLDVYYSDGFYNEYSTTHTFTIEGSNQGTNTYQTSVITAIILLIIGFIGVRYYVKRKRSKESEDN